MLRTALVAVAILGLPATAFAQATVPAQPPARPPGHAGNGTHSGSTTNASGAYRPAIVIDPNAYLASPRPHPTKSASHATVKNAAGYATFHSYSSDR